MTDTRKIELHVDDERFELIPVEYDDAYPRRFSDNDWLLHLGNKYVLGSLDTNSKENPTNGS